MGATIYRVSCLRDGVEQVGSIAVSDEDIRDHSTVICSKMRQEGWYSNQPVTIIDRRHQDGDITRAAGGSTASELHRSAYEAMSKAHNLLAQHAQQGCPSCHAFQPTVRTLRDQLGKSGYASASTTKPVMGVQLHPALAPGEGLPPGEAARDPVSGQGLGSGRASISDLARLNCGEIQRLLVPATSRRKQG